MSYDLTEVCKGMWEEEVEGINQEFICPLRDNCLRYKIKNNLTLRTFFDIVPISRTLDSGECKQYIPFWG